MKIHYLSSSPLHLSPANAVHVMNMCESLATIGNDVTLHARFDGVSKDFHSIYGVDSNFNIKLKKTLEIKILAPVIYSIMQVLSIKKNNEILCYSRCPISAYFASLRGLEIVFEIHEIPHNRMLKCLYSKILTSKKLSRIVVISKSLAEDLKASFLLSQNLDIVVAHDGANTLKNNSSNDGFFKRDGFKKVIGYAGGLRKGNGINLILDLAKENTDLLFVFAGGKPEEIKCWSEVYSGNNVCWVGQLVPHEVPSFLLACDILVAPYQAGPKTSAGRDTGRWMSPLKLFEYMATGKAIMVSDFPVLREVVSDNEAFLIAQNDYKAWNTALSKLVEDDNLSEQIGKNASLLLEEKYTWDKRAEFVIEGL